MSARRAGRLGGPEADEIRARAARDASAKVNRVGVLYGAIGQILKDRSRIPDTAFDASTVPRQGSWNEWAAGTRRTLGASRATCPASPPQTCSSSRSPP